jgi:hypothetical protein
MKKNVNIMQYGIFIDHKKAIIVAIDGENNISSEEYKFPASPSRFAGEGTDKTGLFRHTLNRQDHKQQRAQAEFKKFCKEIVGKLNKANQVYIFGPAEGKYDLYREIEGRKSMSEVYVEIGTSDKMKKTEIVRAVKEHFSALA